MRRAARQRNEKEKAKNREREKESAEGRERKRKIERETEKRKIDKVCTLIVRQFVHVHRGNTNAHRFYT